MNHAAPSLGVCFKRVLLTTDFSPEAYPGISFVLKLARGLGSAISIVRLSPLEMEPGSPTHHERPRSGQTELNPQIRDLPQELASIENSLNAVSVPLTAGNRIDLLAVALYGRKLTTGVMAALQPSIRNAECPVLTVGPMVESNTDSASAGIARILYATDFSPESLAAAQLAISLALRCAAQLTLLHVLQTMDQDLVSSARDTLRDIIPLGTRFAAPPKFVVKQGEFDRTILDYANRDHADVIVLGFRSPAGAPANYNPMNRSVDTITQNAQCPVLTARN